MERLRLIFIAVGLLVTTVSVEGKEAPIKFDYEQSIVGGTSDVGMDEVPTNVNNRISDNVNVFYSSFRKTYNVPGFSLTILNDLPEIPDGPLGVLMILFLLGLGFILAIYILFEVYLFLSFLFGG